MKRTDTQAAKGGYLFSFWQAARGRLGYQSRGYGRVCGVCGRRTWGNRLVGYWRRCDSWGYRRRDDGTLYHPRDKDSRS